ncbi:3-oxoacyl-ACP reductase FabG [Sporanaerobacter acetigenes]|uniref:3-oxoacyl-[acyl-carrier-protein] reductase n=1 Tax=Sporanaerobacter acetigenes DSM 13106 TaxID=1123281 RepID=A0A1M5VZ07_9FIRM|nr:3-oxoacyl-ACP reductase FabG [Sporanaerobacter acetigenes]SHH80420.1 3-oxoacyl-[acyl-carrier-protein] reductase [Sporanaerobacter acetigenes DSM 13106]
MRLEGKVAIITGAGSGIGRATSIKFAQEGAKVVVVDVNVDGINETVKEIEQIGGVARGYKMDVTNRSEIEEVVEKTVKEFGKLDVLVNNAGITKDSTLKKMTEEQWDAVININLKGVFNCGQVAALQMIEQKSGVILNAASVVALYGNFGQTNYAAAKFGVVGMTKTWAKELGRKGIRVNAVAPGFIRTPMTAGMPENVLKGMEESTPLGRLGEAEEIANAYAFLASEEASYITGTVLSVDGGKTL